jgi:hypothetical protein
MPIYLDNGLARGSDLWVVTRHLPLLQSNLSECLVVLGTAFRILTATWDHFLPVRISASHEIVDSCRR